MFVAVVPPESVIEDLEEFVAPRREATPFRWTEPEQWHLTLAFSGDVPERAYDDLVERLGRAARKRHPVEARIPVAAPSPTSAGRRSSTPASRPRSRSCAGWRREPGRRSRSPALRSTASGSRRTSRSPGSAGRSRRAKFVRLLDAYAGPRWTVEEIALVASYLGEGPRNRPRHEVVETFSLGRAGSGPAPDDAPPRGR